MKKNPFFLIVAALVLVLVIVLPFCFKDWNAIFVNLKDLCYLYYSVKTIFAIVLVAVTLWIYLAEKARGQAGILFGATCLLQFVPLLVRLGANVTNFEFGFGLIISCVFAIVYVIFIGLAFHSNKKQVVSDKKYVGKTIEVVSEEEAEKRNHK